MQGWPFGVHHLNQGFNNHRIEGTQRGVFTHEQVRFRSQRVHHTCNFYRDVASTHYCHAFWHGIQLKEAVGVDAVFGTWD
ncbi:hypothetical protein D3C80_1660070 [compost metagenome]